MRPLLLVCFSAAAVYAQPQNPLKAAKEAWEKARRDAQQQQPSRQAPRPAPGLPPSQSPIAQPVAQEHPADTLAALARSMPLLPQDFAAFLELSGVRFGMTIQEAAAALRARNPTYRLQPNTMAMPTIPQPVLTYLHAFAAANSAERLFVEFTLPPERQRVYRIYREFPNQRIHRDTLLAALREKYGPNPMRFGDNLRDPAPSDAAASHLLWLFTPDGKPSRAFPPNESPICHNESPGGGVNRILTVVNNGASNPYFGFNNYTPWCAANYAGLHVTLHPEPDPKIINSYNADFLYYPLATLTSAATTAWWFQTLERLRTQDLERSKQVKPVF